MLALRTPRMAASTPALLPCCNRAVREGGRDLKQVPHRSRNSTGCRDAQPARRHAGSPDGRSRPRRLGIAERLAGLPPRDQIGRRAGAAHLHQASTRPRNSALLLKRPASPLLRASPRSRGAPHGSCRSRSRTDRVRRGACVRHHAGAARRRSRAWANGPTRGCSRWCRSSACSDRQGLRALSGDRLDRGVVSAELDPPHHRRR